MPVLTLEKAPALAEKLSVTSVLNVARRRVPAWSVAVIVLLAIAAGFVAGRQKPAHHYVSYFGYPMVLDTTTGKACYAVPPKPASAVQDAAFATDGTANQVDAESPNGPSIPLCGQE